MDKLALAVSLCAMALLIAAGFIGASIRDRIGPSFYFLPDGEMSNDIVKYKGQLYRMQPVTEVYEEGP